MIELTLLIAYIIVSKILIAIYANNISLQIAEAIHILLLLELLIKYIKKRKIIDIKTQKKDRIIILLFSVAIFVYDILLGIKYIATPYYLPGDAYSYYIYVLSFQGHSKVVFQPNYFVENIILPSIISQIFKPYIVTGYFMMNFLLQIIGIVLIYKALYVVESNQKYIKLLLIWLFLFLYTIPPIRSEDIYLKIYRIFPDLWGYEYYKLFAIFSTFLVAYVIFRRKATINNEVISILIASLIFFYPHYGILIYLVDIIFFGKNNRLLIYSIVELAILYITNVISLNLLIFATIILFVIFMANFKLRQIITKLLFLSINLVRNNRNVIYIFSISILFITDLIPYFFFSSASNIGLLNPLTWIYIDLPLIFTLLVWSNRDNFVQYQTQSYDYFTRFLMILQVLISISSYIPVKFIQFEALNPYKSMTLFYLLIIIVVIVNRSLPRKYLFLYFNVLISVAFFNWIIYYFRYLSYFPTLGNSSVNLDIANSIVMYPNHSYYIATKDVPLWHLFLFIDSQSAAIHPYAYNSNLSLFRWLIFQTPCFNIVTSTPNYIYFSVNFDKCKDFIIIGYGFLANNLLHSETPIVVVMSNDKLLHLRNFPIVKLDNITQIVSYGKLYIIEVKSFSILGYSSPFISYDTHILFILLLLRLFSLLILSAYSATFK